MLKVGITGGIGSGKSTIGEIISSMGYKIFNSDNVAKEIIQSNEEVRYELINLFGIDLFDGTKLNKEMLAKEIFSNEKSRLAVNEIVHPRVRAAYDAFVEANRKDKLLFNEAAILIETGGHEKLDKLILVTAPEELRIQRVIKRDGTDRQSVFDRMNKQWSDKEKMRYADIVILNDEKLPLIPQVIDAVNSLLS